MLACSSNKRYACEHSLMATEFKDSKNINDGHFDNLWPLLGGHSYYIINNKKCLSEHNLMASEIEFFSRHWFGFSLFWHAPVTKCMHFNTN